MEGETSDESMCRKLIAISMIRKNQLPHLWSVVSDQILQDGKLDVSYTTLGVQNLDDLTYLFASGAATNISALK